MANARAERAEADRADERLRADNLRAQIDVLNAKIVAMRAEADREMAEERLRADWLSEQVACQAIKSSLSVGGEVSAEFRLRR